MGQKIPFTTFDFWAYLSAGFLFLFAADQVVGTNLLSREKWTVVQGIIAVSAAYSVGQLASSVASNLLERLLVGKLLGYPREVLFGYPKAWKWVRPLLPGYFTYLPARTRQLALEKGQAVGIHAPGDDLFLAAYSHARSVPVVLAKLENFLNQYVFCRNTALVAFADAALFYWSYRWGHGTANFLEWSWAATAIGVGMTFRYLKYYRNFSVEVFTSYAYSKAKEQ